MSAEILRFNHPSGSPAIERLILEPGDEQTFSDFRNGEMGILHVVCNPAGIWEIYRTTIEPDTMFELGDPDVQSAIQTMANRKALLHSGKQIVTTVCDSEGGVSSLLIRNSKGQGTPEYN